MSFARFHSVQALRAVAALLVVTHHAITMGHDGAPFQPFLSILPSFDEFGCAGVDIFFVISGFIMAHTIAGHAARPTAGVFLSRRAVRILPPFWTVSLAAIAMELVLHGSWPGKWSLLNGITILPLSDIETFRTNPAPLYLSWTLAFEIVFYLLVAVALTVQKYNPVKCTLMLCSALALAGLLYNSRWSPLAFAANFIFAEFCLGLLAWVIWRRWRHVRASSAIIMSGVFLFAIGLTVDAGQGFSPDPALVIAGRTSLIRTFVWGVPAFLMVLGAAFDRSQIRGAISLSLERIGGASYSIYLLHPLIIGVLRDMGLRAWGNDMLFVAATIILSVGGGLLLFRYFERPTTRMFHRWLTQMADRRARWPTPAAAS